MFLQMIPMNQLKQLIRITDFVNQFIKNVTNLGKKNIYIGLKLGRSLALKKDSRKAQKWIKKKKEFKK